MAENQEAPQRVYGIDLGTTYSCVAYVNDVGVPVVVPGDNQSNVIPSVVLFEDDASVLVGEFAKADLLSSPENVVARVKDHMGEVNSDGEPWTVRRAGQDQRPEYISSLILRKLSENVAANTPDEGIFSAVITVPAYFNAAQRTATEQAGQAAGFSVKGVIPEPTAAALSYSLDSKENQTVLVYDLGGGTFDTTVINIDDGSVNVVCTGGSRSLGGIQWDERIMEYFRDTWQSAHGSDVNPLEDPIANQTIADQAETAKRRLTSAESVSVSIQYQGKTERVEITRETFDDITKDLLEQTIAFTESTLNIAKEKGCSAIDKVLLVGGSCYMRQVKETVEARFGIPAQLHRPDMAVAEGAAIYGNDEQIRLAYRQAVEILGQGAADDDLKDKVIELLPPGADRERIEVAQRIDVKNVSSKHFGTITRVGPDQPDLKQISWMIRKNDPVPSIRDETFHTVNDNQSFVLFELIESDAENPQDPEILERDHRPDAEYDYILPGHAQRLGKSVRVALSGDTMAGSPVNLKYQLSPDGGRLRATATDPGTNNVEEVEISNIGALSEEEINQMQDAIREIKIQ